MTTEFIKLGREIESHKVGKNWQSDNTVNLPTLYKYFYTNLYTQPSICGTDIVPSWDLRKFPIFENIHILYTISIHIGVQTKTNDSVVIILMYFFFSRLIFLYSRISSKYTLHELTNMIISNGNHEGYSFHLRLIDLNLKLIKSGWDLNSNKDA